MLNRSIAEQLKLYTAQQFCLSIFVAWRHANNTCW